MFESRVYRAAASQLLDLAREAPREAPTMLVIGTIPPCGNRL
jgi:hypothetical protein